LNLLLLGLASLYLASWAMRQGLGEAFDPILKALGGS
jgi:hypothetical protein